MIEKFNLRQPKFLSPTNIGLYFKDREEWFDKYMSPTPPPREGQTQPMSVGSAFDAKVKSFICNDLNLDEKLDYDELFQNQVEEHNREWARVHGEKVFEAYLNSGAYDDLIRELSNATDHKFEFEVTGRIPYSAIKGGIPIKGIPDLRCKLKDEWILIFDWKVNGYCSSYKTSPKKGYLFIRDGNHQCSRSHLTQHKDVIEGEVAGLTINKSNLEHIDTRWADQLTTYSWLLGVPVGGRFIAGIEQIVGQENDLRVASYRGLISQGYQDVLLAKYAQVWRSVQTGEIFPENNEDKIRVACNKHVVYENTDDFSVWMRENVMTEKKFY